LTFTITVHAILRQNPYTLTAIDIRNLESSQKLRNMHMTEQVAVVMQRLRQVIFFDIHVIEIADNLYMFKIVFDDVTAGIGEG
ncbi:hypothetical protein, partial [Pseudomonas aeruginosa]|uniref:hypothetical protein n=1 Tax=Pseudomonas aeruginosa TaxID=287 RepID=UPI0019694E3C